MGVMTSVGGAYLSFRLKGHGRESLVGLWAGVFLGESHMWGRRKEGGEVRERQRRWVEESWRH